jgi:hypothetical protein
MVVLDCLFLSSVLYVSVGEGDGVIAPRWSGCGWGNGEPAKLKLGVISLDLKSHDVIIHDVV